MPRKPQDVTDAELAVLQVLWDRESATIREVTQVVYPDDPETQYSTVKRLLARLAAKGFVDSDKSGFVHVFHATVDREDLVGRRLESLAESLCEGSISPLLSSLAKSDHFTKAQQAQLLSLIDELKQEPSSAKKKQKSRRKRT